MKITPCLFAIALVLPGCLGGPLEEPVASTRQPITGGEPESGYLAVFSLAFEGQPGCTGTCITPKVATTATHCLGSDPAESFTGLFGSREDSATATLQVTASAVAPDGGDFALVAFAEACPETIPYNRIALEGHIGEPVVMVGFGVTTESANDAGIKRSGVATLFSVDPAEVNGLEAGELATSNDPDGTCNGDSGGPTFMTFDGLESMVGTTSRGSLDSQGREYPCGQGRSIAVRADHYASFIDDFIAQHDPEAGDGPGGPGGDDGNGDGDPPDGDPGGDGTPDDPTGSDGSMVGGCGCHAGGGGPGAAGGALALALGLAAFLVVRRRARCARQTP